MEDNARPTNSDAAVKKKCGIIRYVVVFALLAMVRIFEAVIDGTHWQVLAYESVIAWCVASGVAVLICCIATGVFRSHYPPAITILISVVIGATSTLIINSMPGMLIGLIVGAIFTFDVSRSLCLQVLKYALIAGLPAFAIAVTLGFLGGLWLVRVETPAQASRMAAVVCVCLLLLAFFWAYLTARRRGKRTSEVATVFAIFLTAAILAFPLGVQLDNNRRVLLSGSHSYKSILVPIGYQNLVRGFVEPANLWLWDGVSEAQGELLKPFRNLSDIHLAMQQRAPSSQASASVERPTGQLFVDGLSRLDLTKVINLETHSWLVSGFTDEALLAFRESSGVNVVSIPVSDVTDKGLAAFAKMTWLMKLDLSASEVKGSGFRHFHPSAPLAFVNLAGSKVNDDALSHFSGRATESLDLSGTPVTGIGFEGVKLPRLLGLNLATSKFNEQHIGLLPPSVRHLDITGTRLTKTGVAELARRQSIASLRLLKSAIDDESAAELSKLQMGKLAIDATNLSVAACKSFFSAMEIELEFCAGGQTGGSFEEIAQRCRAMRREIWRLKGTPNSVSISIRGLTVGRDMIETLRELDCQLYEVKLEDLKSHQLYLPNERYLLSLGVLPGRPLDANDLSPIFQTEIEVTQ